MTGGFAAYPLLLEPRLHRRLWGGGRLVGWLAGGEALPVVGPEGEPAGEAWLVEGGAAILNGPYAGLTLDALAAAAGAELVGEAAVRRYGPRAPLLAKYLDAAQDLSVQVHPGDAYALREHPGSGHLGKAEAWYVLAAEPGAAVWRGFRRDVTKGEVKRAVADGSLTGLMHRLPVRVGDVIVNPPGTVHAVGAGCFLFEIQQPSDLTYRLYDHGRLGADGKERELHVERALDVADLKGGEPPGFAGAELPDGWTRLVTRPEFTLDRVRLDEGEVARGRTEPRSLELLVAVSGAAVVTGGGRTESLERGGAAVLPAALGPYEVRGSGEVLRAAVGA